MGVAQVSAGATLAEAQTSRSRIVVVHRGARDGYEVGHALAEAGLLDTLVTDLYWPAERGWARRATTVLPASVRSMLAARNNPGLPSQQVTQTLLCGLLSHGLDKLRCAPFSWRKRATRWTDACLGRYAGNIARRANSSLLSYSYYAYDAFSAARAGMLFQLHPHPLSVRRILKRELNAHPDCATSLKKEWELSLPEKSFQRLVEETQLAKSFLVASSFTRRTLVENGVDSGKIHVVPYGIDLKKFSPGETTTGRPSGPLKLLFVGTINQRKGIKYLIEALRLLRSKKVHLTVCGRVVDDLSLFNSVTAQVDIRPSVSYVELLDAYRTADLFVLPSVAEGFGQVLLEALACGLPILSTTRTAAPDLVDEGVQGFVVEPGRPDLLAGRISWALDHRPAMREMRTVARRRAEQFTWQRFREGVVEAVLKFQAANADSSEVLANYV